MFDPAWVPAAARLALDAINEAGGLGKQVELIVEDDQTGTRKHSVPSDGNRPSQSGIEPSVSPRE